MVQLIKSVHQFQFNKEAVKKVELPLFTFNKLCYGFLSNDLAMVTSSTFTLITTMTLMVFSQIRDLNINQ